MRLHLYRNIKLIYVGFSSFILGYILSYINTDICIIPTSQDVPDYDIILVILTSPQNYHKRDAIRKTWLRLKDNINYNSFESTLDYMDVPIYNQEGFLKKDTTTIQKQRLIKYATKLKTDSAQLRPQKHFSRTRFKVKHLFSIGTNGLSTDIISSIKLENSKFDDILLLPSLNDSYRSLTNKIVQTFEKVSILYKFKYILKCDDDSFIKLDTVIEELEAYDHNVMEIYKYNTSMPQLYWGYFNGAARVKHSGPWAEKEWFLCDRYLPYALGGGYILSAYLVKYIVNNDQHFSKFNSEDVSVGAWLAPLNNVYRRHDPRFNTEANPRKMSLLHIVLHKVSPMEMKSLLLDYKNEPYENINVEEVGYIYNWEVLPSKCYEHFI
ncbi:beta-1,3-galactosyltransferase 6-like [Ctenocephalides felis]|uniref:beta-1,3-galactosyltransferase 6-like n=1 Tax=Ctenocephalides felis TaxID=7515 RepID=UPI000E6E44C1|nr:beta-1,3-galactosyltransferase 6-like [Ctenocephalides felis]